MGHWAAGERITGDKFTKYIQGGSKLVSFTSQTSFTTTVTFPVAFDEAPIMHTNIAVGAGETARWGSRAISISATGFTLFVFSPVSSDPSRTWTDIEVQWIAVSP